MLPQRCSWQSGSEIPASGWPKGPRRRASGPSHRPTFHCRNWTDPGDRHICIRPQFSSFNCSSGAGKRRRGGSFPWLRLDPRTTAFHWFYTGFSLWGSRRDQNKAGLGSINVLVCGKIQPCRDFCLRLKRSLLVSDQSGSAGISSALTQPRYGPFFAPDCGRLLLTWGGIIG